MFGLSIYSYNNNRRVVMSRSLVNNVVRLSSWILSRTLWLMVIEAVIVVATLILRGMTGNEVFALDVDMIKILTASALLLALSAWLVSMFSSAHRYYWHVEIVSPVVVVDSFVREDSVLMESMPRQRFGIILREIEVIQGLNRVGEPTHGERMKL